MSANTRRVGAVYGSGVAKGTRTVGGPLGLALDAAAAFAEGAVVPMQLARLLRAPRGDGHPVLVLPGLMAGDTTTLALRRFLRGRGWHAHRWHLGVNVGPTEVVTEGLEPRLRDLADRHQRAVSLVGWSLGGVFATQLARRAPDVVRIVVTLGSPVFGQPPEVPITAVYSKSDRIVPWRDALLADGPRTENVEVRGSHIGLGANPEVLRIVADRLSQPEGGWKPYTR